MISDVREIYRDGTILKRKTFASEQDDEGCRYKSSHLELYSPALPVMVSQSGPWHHRDTRARIVAKSDFASGIRFCEAEFSLY